MGTIADKLTYLNTTKQNLKDSINNLGGNITSETTFRNYANVLNNIFDSLPKITGKDSILNLSPTLKGRLISTIYGNTLQNGTPTPSSPVPIQNVTGLQKINVVGNNLFDKDSVITGKYYSATGTLTDFTNGYGKLINVIGNTKYSLKIDNNYNSTIRLMIFVYDKDMQRLAQIRWGDTLASESSYTNQNYTMPNDAKYIGISVLDMPPTTENINKVPIQLEVGSTATEYEPYQGQEYDINLAGKNLFDENTIQSVVNGTNDDGFITSNTWTSGSWVGTTVTFKPMKISREFTISMEIRLTDGSTGTFSKFNDGVQNLIEVSKPTLSNQWQKYVYKYTPSSSYSINKFFIQLISITGEIQIRNMQIEYGSTASEYTPYFTPIELNEIGDYQDYISGTPNNWVINRQIGKVVLDGSENYNSNQSTDNEIRFNTPILGEELPKVSNTGFSNYFLVQAESNRNGLSLYSGGDENIYIWVKKQIASTTADFKTWLSTHNTIVNYVLATPTTEPITNTELINQLNALYNAKSYDGTTNIIVSGDLAAILDVSVLKGE